MTKRTTVLTAVFAVFLSCALSVKAENYDYYWTGAADSNYFTQGNWQLSDGSPAPISLDANTQDRITANIQNSNGGAIKLDYDNLAPRVYTLNLGNAGGSTTATLSRSGSLRIDSGKTFNILNGGNYTHTSGDFINNGTFNLSGGSFTLEKGAMATQIQSNGTINVSGGTFTVASAQSTRIGQSANSTLNISGGEVTVNNPTYIGVNPGVVGEVVQTGGTATFNGTLEFGWGGSSAGKYTLSGGTLTTKSTAGLDRFSSQPSYFTVNGGTANLKSFTVGFNGSGSYLTNTFALSSGTVNVEDAFSVLYGGILKVTGGSFTANEFTLDANSSFVPGPGSAVTVTGSSGAAELYGVVDFSEFSRHIGTYGESCTVFTANSITGNPTFTNVPADWTLNHTATDITLTYNGGADKYFWTGNAPESFKDKYYTAANWEINGSPYQPDNGLLDDIANPSFTKDCYILDTKGVNVYIDFNDLGVASLTVGNGTGDKSATIYRNDTLYLRTSLKINNGATAQFEGIEFQFPRIGVESLGVLNVTGGTINLGSGGITNSARAYTINISGGTFGNYQNGSDDSSWSSALNATITSNAVTFAPSDGNTITWSGVLSGAGGVAVDGAGTLILSNDNTYAGGTTISQGTLKLTDSGALGTGAIVNNGTLEFAHSTDQTFSRVISGSGTIRKTGAGTLSLSSTSNNAIGNELHIENGTVALTNSVNGNNRFTKPVTVYSGATLRLDAHDSIGYSDAMKTFNLSGGTLALNVESNETLRSAIINFTGGTITTLSNSASQFDIYDDPNAYDIANAFNVYAAADATADNPTVSYVNGWVRLRNSLDFNITVAENAKLVFGKDFGITYLNNQGVKPIVKLGSGVMVFEGTNTYGAGTTISEGTLILRENGSLGTGAVVNNGTLEFDYSADKTIPNAISGDGVVIKNGQGTVTISGANTYTGGTTISQGTLKLTDSGALGTGAIVNNGTLEFAHSTDQTFSSVISGSGTIRKTGAGTLSLSSTSNNSIDNELFIENGTVALTNSVNGNNRFTKPVTVYSGATLRIDAHDSIGYSDAMKTFNLSGGTLALNGNFNETLINTTINFVGGTMTTLSNSNSRFDIYNAGNAFNVDAATGATADNPTVSYVNGWVRLRNSTDFNITVNENAKLVFGSNFGITNTSEGVKPIVKLGAGVMVFEGANSYTAGTTISEGTLVLKGNGNIGTGDVAIGTNGVLEFDCSGDKTFTNAISGSGKIVKQGTDTVNLNSAFTFTGDMAINGGVVSILSSDDNNNSVINITNLSGSGDLELRLAKTGHLSLPNITSDNFTGVISLVKGGSATNIKLYLKDQPADGLTFAVNPGTTLYYENTDHAFTPALKADVILSGTGNSENCGAFRAGANMEGNITIMEDATIGFDLANITFSGDITAGASSGEVTMILKPYDSNDKYGVFTGSISDGDAGAKLGVRVSNGTQHVLSGDLSYTGATTIDSGTRLTLTGDGTNLVNSSAVTVNGMLDFLGYTGENAMTFNNLTGTNGVITSGNNDLILNNDQASTYSGEITANNIEKTGDETLTINTGDSGFVDAQSLVVTSGRLNLTGARVNLVDASYVTVNGTLDFSGYTGEDDMIFNNLTGTNGTIIGGRNKGLILNINDQESKYTGSISVTNIEKTGDETLKIYTGADGRVDAQSFVVSSGELDFKGYMTGTIAVEADAVFSPGNSVGEATVGGDFILNDANSSILMELGGQNPEQNDSLIVQGNLQLNNGFIELILSEDSALVEGDTFTAILTGANSADLANDFISKYVRSSDFRDLKYVPLNDGSGYYAITGRFGSASTPVPEPGTWALLILGAVGMLFWRKNAQKRA